MEEIDIKKILDSKSEYKKKIYEALCNGSSQWTFLIDKNSKIVFIGNSSKSITGYSNKELHSNFSTILDFIHKEDIEKFIEHTKQLISGSVKQFSIQIKIYSKDNQLKHLRLSAQVIDELFTEQLFIYKFSNVTEFYNSKIIIKESEFKLQHKQNEISLQEEEYYAQNEEIKTINEELRGINEEFKVVNKQIARSEKKYKLLFNKMNDGFALCEVLFDKNGYVYDYKFLEVNSKYEELMMLNKGACLGKSYNEIFTVKDNDLIDKFGQVALSQSAIKFKKLNKKLDKFIHYTAYSPIKGQFALIIRDVTEIENTHLALKDSEERFRIIFEDAPDAYYIMSPSGVFINGNKAAENLIGLQRDSLIGKNFAKIALMPTKYLPKALRSLSRNVLDLPTGPDEYQIISKDKRIIDIEVCTYPVRIKGKMSILGIARDITERKIIEGDLRAKSMVNKVFAEISQDLLQSDYSVTKMADAICNAAKKVTNSKDVFISALKRVKKSYNLTLMSKPPGSWWLELGEEDVIINDKNKEAVEFLVSLLMKSEGFYINSPKNFPIFSSIVNSPLKVNKFLTLPLKIDGKTEGQIVLTNSSDNYSDGDIHNVKQMADIFSLALQRKRFENDLVEARKKAEESDRLKSLFVANMSHEIRTPMNGLIGFSQLLKRPNLTPEKRVKYFDIIDSSGKSLLKLVNDIIDISKIESGQLKMEIEDYSVNKIMSDIFPFFDEFRLLKKKTNVKIKMNIDENNDVIIATDSFRLRQVFINLVQNAIKNTEKGIVEYGYRKYDEGTLLFYVKDTGIGIPKEQKDKIFGRFVQVHNRYYQEGTGLGLSISENIVKLLGGKIWVESEFKKGSVFYFTHPISISGVNRYIEKEIIKPKTCDWNDKTIIIAEDNNTNYEFLIEALEHTGIHISRAKTGLEVIALFKKYKPDIILMDMKMPDMDGYAATKKLREIDTKTPIIVQTAYAMAEDKKMCISAGCNDFLPKPIDNDMLISVLGKYL